MCISTSGYSPGGDSQNILNVLRSPRKTSLFNSLLQQLFDHRISLPASHVFILFGTSVVEGDRHANICDGLGQRLVQLGGLNSLSTESRGFCLALYQGFKKVFCI